MTARYVLLEKFCELTGYSADAVRKKIDRGVFVRGVHFDTQGDRLVKIDMEAYQLWARGVPAHVIQEWKRGELRSVYGSSTEAGAPRRSASNLQPQT